MKITTTGTTFNTTATSQNAAIPNAQNSLSPYFVRAVADNPCFIKFGGSTVTATQNDILVTANPQSYDVRGVGGYVAAVSGAFASRAHVLMTGTSMSAVAVTTPGSGYLTVPTVSLTGNATVTLKMGAVAFAPAVAGTGYVPADTITISGGTSTTATIAAVATTKVVTLAVNAAGTGYAPKNTITLAGGTSSVKAVVTVATTKLISAKVSDAGANYIIADTITCTANTGTINTKPVLTVATMGLSRINLNAVGSGYVATDTITLAGGTSSTAAVVTVDSVDGRGGIVTFHISTAGSYTLFQPRFTQASTSGSGTGATFNCLFLGKAGNGTLHKYAAADTITLSGGTESLNGVVTVDSVDANGLILTYHVSTTGTYTVLPGSFTQGSSSGTGTGATFITAGCFKLLTVTVSTPGAFAVNPFSNLTQFSTNHDGRDATFNVLVFGVLTVTLTSGGSYTVNTTSFTQNATSGAGTGATFNTGLYGVNTCTVDTVGAYSVLPANPAAQGSTSGSGTLATLNVTWGVATATLGGTNTGYTSIPVLTLSEIAPTPATFTPALTATTVASVVVDAIGGTYFAAPTVTPSGGNATFTATITNGGVSSIAVGGTNTGYTTVPTLSFSGGLVNGNVNISPVESTGPASSG